MKIKSIALIFFLFSTAQALAQASDDAIARELWSHPTWQKLLHYKKGLFGVKSEVSDPGFFLDPKGSYDAKAELLTNVHALFDNQSFFEIEGKKVPIRCRFPARYKWLKKELGLLDRDNGLADCVQYQKMYKTFFPQEIWLVFSSYYVDDPSTTFGHTFLRFAHTRDAKHVDDMSNELLDLGVSYAANSTTDNIILYPIFGMTGVFPGVFSTLPYFYKVREYSIQARDLWSYHLNLTKDQREILLDHLLELTGSYFDYYFFTQNCSYHLLTLIDLVRDDLRLVDALPGLWAIPSDTVKIITEVPGLVKEIRYRPSLFSIYHERTKTLSSSEAEAVKAIAKQEDFTLANAIQPISRQAYVLDTALDYVEYRSPSHGEHADEKAEKLKLKLLQMRASLPYTSDEVKVVADFNDSPDKGHDSARVMLAPAYYPEAGGSIRLGQRFAHHDMLDKPAGYPKNATIEFLNIEGEYFGRSNTLLLNTLSMLHVKTMPYSVLLEKRLSWEFETGFRALRPEVCRSCLSGFFDFGLGRTLWSPQQSFAAQAMFKCGFDVNQEPGRLNLAAALKPQLESYWFANDKWRSALTLEYQGMGTGTGTDRTHALGVHAKSRYAYAYNRSIEVFVHRYFINKRELDNYGLGFFFHY